jgi:hypothetical protein
MKKVPIWNISQFLSNPIQLRASLSYQNFIPLKIRVTLKNLKDVQCKTNNSLLYPSAAISCLLPFPSTPSSLYLAPHFLIIQYLEQHSNALYNTLYLTYKSYNMYHTQLLSWTSSSSLDITGTWFTIAILAILHFWQLLLQCGFIETRLTTATSCKQIID